MNDRKTERRLWKHAGGVFALVLAAGLLLTAYMERSGIRQERDRMSHIAQSVGAETYETLLSEMGKTRVLEAYLIQTGGSYEGFEKVAPILLREELVRNVLFAPGGVVEAVYPMAGNEGAVGLDMNQEGADVFFGDASAVDSGARQAIDETNTASGSVKIYDIAQPSDLLGQNECIICSQVTDNASLVGLCMEAVESGAFGGEVIYGTMQNGVLSAGGISDLVPAEVQDQYLAYIDQMVEGTFMQ